MRTRLSACLAFTLAALAAGESRAEDPPSPVRLSRGPGAERCLSEDALAKAVAERLGAVPPYRTIEGHVERAAGKAGFQATLALIGPNGATIGTREVWTRSLDCRALDGDLTLVASLLLDPEGPFPPGPPPATTSEASEPRPAESATLTTTDALPSPPPPAPGSTTPTKADSPSPVGDSEPPPAPWSVVARAGAVFSMGLLPAIGTGVALHTEVSPPGLLPVEIGAVYWSEQRVSTAGGAFGADLWVAYASLDVCPIHGEQGGFLGAACAGVEIGAVHVGRSGAAAPGASNDLSSDTVVPFASAVVGARVLRTIHGPFYGGASLDISMPLVRPDLYYRVGGVRREAFVASPILGALEISVGVRLQ